MSSDVKKKSRIKNKHYREFLDTGLIQILNEEHIQKALQNASNTKYQSTKNSTEARSLILMLYYTGARPNEVLRLKGKDCAMKGKYFTVKLPSSKGGLPRVMFLPIKKSFVKEMAKYCLTIYDEMYLFYNFTSRYVRRRTTKSGKDKVFIEIADSLRYWFKKWFDGVLEEAIPPYYLRHNRFSKLIEAGISLEDARMLKGSRTFASITPYIHMSGKAAKNIAKKND